MSPTPARTSQGRSNEAILPGEDVVQLVRALVARVGPDPADPRPDEHVLLDVDVDGVRCVLVARGPAEAEVRAHLNVALSPREQEIARMVAEGYPNKTIAAVLDISSWTVSTHLRRIFAKVGVRTRAAMVARVLEDGLMDRRVDDQHGAGR